MLSKTIGDNNDLATLVGYKIIESTNIIFPENFKTAISSHLESHRTNSKRKGNLYSLLRNDLINLEKKMTEPNKKVLRAGLAEIIRAVDKGTPNVINLRGLTETILTPKKGGTRKGQGGLRIARKRKATRKIRR